MIGDLPDLPNLPNLAAQLQDIVDDLSELLSAPAVLEDTDFKLVAYCSQGLDVDPVRAASILGRAASPQVKAYFEEQGIKTATGPLHVPGSLEQQIAPRACLPARTEGRTRGYLWVLEPEAGIDAARLALAAPLARRAGELLALRQQGAGEHQRLVEELLSGNLPVAEAARAALVRRGELTDGEGPVAVVVIRTPAGPAATRVLSVPSGDPASGWLGPAIRRVSRLVATEGRAGIGGPRGTLGELREGRHEADCAARVSLGRPRLGPVVSWGDLGFYRVVARGAGAVEALIAQTPASRLRARAEAELVRTALVYLDEAGHAARTAAALSVHRQTLYYRLEKIEQLSGVDLDDGEARLQLHLGLALGEILPHLRSD